MGRTTEVLLGAGRPDAPALVEGHRVLTYAGLHAAVTDRADALDLLPRSLVVLGMTNTLEAVITYLAVLQGGHVPLLAGAHHGSLVDAWEPDALIHADADGWSVEHRPGRPDRRLHPDLALLLSTSGSTGAPKLVRLSHENVASNAVAISDYLALTPEDRAVTSLPLHYCYGLSVLHSHLAAGAGVVMTSASVVDPCFAAALREGGVTNIAGVPHTFDLLDQAGAERVHVPTLRFMTQAGGRMAPDRVRSWVDRTDGWGVDLYVMYGQTEATARMAYLAPALARQRPDAIGRPIPGGELELRPVDGAPEGVGEIVYRGPNVMLGYATQPGDLAEGATLHELATGDLGRYDARHGVFEVVGRRSRFVKPFGVRIDLDSVEGGLGEAGFEVVVTGDDDRVVVGAPGQPVDDVRRRVADLTGLPLAAIVVDASAIPRTAAGKVDHGALLRRTPTPRIDASAAGSAEEVFATVLGRRDVSPASTFVELGGDSLSYVECSVLLEERLGRLPSDWHLRRADELDALGVRKGMPRLDTTALLRAAGILFVVSTHMRLWYFPGGSHLMLAVVGYNACRFLFSIGDVAGRVAAAGRSIARLAVPTLAFVGLCMVLVGGYGLPTLGLVNGYVGPADHLDGRWHYWFIEVAVQLLVLTTALLAIGPVRRIEQRFPYAFALALFAVTVGLRELWVTDNLRFQLHGVAWFFVLGWLVYRSNTVATKVTSTVVCALAIHGFFGMPHREWLIASGVVLLLWCREIPMPRFAIRPIATVAAASMAIYVSHFRIWKVLDRNLDRGWAYLLTVLAGIAIWFLADRAMRAVRRRVAAPFGVRQVLPVTSRQRTPALT